MEALKNCWDFFFNDFCEGLTNCLMAKGIISQISISRMQSLVVDFSRTEFLSIINLDLWKFQATKFTESARKESKKDDRILIASNGEGFWFLMWNG